MAYFCVRTHTPRTAPMRLEPKPRRMPAQEEIARLAYSYWEARGRQSGSPEEDWYRAERELKRAADVKPW